MTSEYSNDINLDKKRLDRIKYNILFAERENLRTRSDNPEQMVEKLRRIIEEEVKKCY
jgi:hypothetical protein